MTIVIDLEFSLCEEGYKDIRGMRDSKSVTKSMDCKFQRGPNFIGVGVLESWKNEGIGWRVGYLRSRLWGAGCCY